MRDNLHKIQLRKINNPRDKSTLSKKTECWTHFGSSCSVNRKKMKHRHFVNYSQTPHTHTFNIQHKALRHQYKALRHDKAVASSQIYQIKWNKWNSCLSWNSLVWHIKWTTFRIIKENMYSSKWHCTTWSDSSEISMSQVQKAWIFPWSAAGAFRKQGEFKDRGRLRVGGNAEVCSQLM